MSAAADAESDRIDADAEANAAEAAVSAAAPSRRRESLVASDRRKDESIATKRKETSEAEKRNKRERNLLLLTEILKSDYPTRLSPTSTSKTVPLSRARAPSSNLLLFLSSGLHAPDDSLNVSIYKNRWKTEEENEFLSLSLSTSSSLSPSSPSSRLSLVFSPSLSVSLSSLPPSSPAYCLYPAYSLSAEYGVQTILAGSTGKPAEPAALRCFSSKLCAAQTTCCPFWY